MERQKHRAREWAAMASQLQVEMVPCKEAEAVWL